MNNTAHLAQPDEQVKDVGVVVEQSACSTECTFKDVQLQQLGRQHHDLVVWLQHTYAAVSG